MIFGLPGGIEDAAVGEVAGSAVLVADAAGPQLERKIRRMASEMTFFMEMCPFLDKYTSFTVAVWPRCSGAYPTGSVHLSNFR